VGDARQCSLRGYSAKPAFYLFKFNKHFFQSDNLKNCGHTFCYTSAVSHLFAHCLQSSLLADSRLSSLNISRYIMPRIQLYNSSTDRYPGYRLSCRSIVTCDAPLDRCETTLVLSGEFVVDFFIDIN
jgi:hypothetical protein